MDLNALREIGRSVYLKVSGLRIKGEAPMERGAGGDRTFPVDKIAEDAILRGLEALKEPFSVVTEEAGVLEIGRGEARKLVVIDPIDGSKNAVAGIPYFGASIAVALGDTIGSIALGYVINLVNGGEFMAERGRGASQNGVPLRSQADGVLYLTAYEAQSPARDLKKILPLLEASRKTRCLGAIALDLAYVASGAASILVNPAPSRSFDFAAGYLLVREAGGIFTDTGGRSIESGELGIGRGASLLAAGNSTLHEAALKLLHGQQT